MVMDKLKQKFQSALVSINDNYGRGTVDHWTMERAGNDFGGIVFCRLQYGLSKPRYTLKKRDDSKYTLKFRGHTRVISME